MGVDVDREVPVLIVGAGPAGLMTALVLARHGIASMLVERHFGTSVLPRATGINVRTMEILRALGLEEDARSKSPDTREMDYIIETQVLGGPIVGRVSYPSDSDANDEDAPSPCQWCFVAQDEFEPIVLASLERMRRAHVVFGTELIRIDQDEQRLQATLGSRDSGRDYVVEARYLVAADGARSHVREALGIGMSGHDHLSHSLNILFEADLAAAVRGRAALLHLVQRSEPLGTASFAIWTVRAGAGVFSPIGLKAHRRMLARMLCVTSRAITPSVST
jgi:2-polyprenyl-6-methoxyphenol hydroxylase-like FAD-dependent oxidoreductase